MEAANPSTFENFFHRDLIHTIDTETAMLSGGFEKHPDYALLRSQGEAILPLLYESLHDSEAGFWWRAQLIAETSYQTTGHTPYDNAELGKHEQIEHALLSWGQQHGFLGQPHTP